MEKELKAMMFTAYTVRIQENTEYGPENTPYLGTFHAGVKFGRPGNRTK